MTMRRMFLVSFAVPSGATVEEMTGYVQDAVRSYCGGLDTRDAMFNLDRKSVLAEHVKKTHLK